MVEQMATSPKPTEAKAHPLFKCHHCDYQATSRFIANHYLNKHADRIKQNNLETAGGPKKSDRMLIFEKVHMEGKKEPSDIAICFGCKKFYMKDGKKYDHHRTNCPKKEEHKKVCQAILEERKEKQGPTESATTKLDNLALKRLQRTVEKLKAQVEQLKEDRADAKDNAKQEFLKTQRMACAINQVLPKQMRHQVASTLNRCYEEEDNFGTNWFRTFKVDEYYEADAPNYESAPHQLIRKHIEGLRIFQDWHVPLFANAIDLQKTSSIPSGLPPWEEENQLRALIREWYADWVMKQMCVEDEMPMPDDESESEEEEEFDESEEEDSDE